MAADQLRERKKTETRRAIAAAALELAVARGPYAITVHDIAASANVSPRTVFNYFGTKDAAILGHDPERWRELATALLARPVGEEPLESLRCVLTNAVTEAADSGNVWVERARLVKDHPELRAVQIASQNALENELANAVATRTGLDVERDLYPLLVSTVALTTIRMVLGRSANAGRVRLRREIDAAFAFVDSGFSIPTNRSQ